MFKFTEKIFRINKISKLDIVMSTSLFNLWLYSLIHSKKKIYPPYSTTLYK
jgi:hypothetical protein